MAGVLLILGLIAAGVYTDSAWFYVGAGAVAGFGLVTWVVAFIAYRKIKNTAVRGFNNFNDDFWKI